MIWDKVMLDAVLPLLRNDAELIAALGGDRIYTAQTGRKIQVPSVEWGLPRKRPGEVLNRLMLQIDYWATNPSQAAVIERRVYNLLHRNRRRTIAGLNLGIIWEETTEVDSSIPSAIHGVLRFEILPVRPRAAA